MTATRTHAPAPGPLGTHLHLSVKQWNSGEGHSEQERAWCYLFREKTTRLVTRWLRKLRVPAVDRRDLTQTVLLEAFKSFPTYDPHRARPERWLNRIALHVVADYADKAHHRHEVAAGFPGLKAVDPRPSAVHALLAEERRLHLLQVIHRLPSHLAWILVEHDLHGHRMQELAVTARVPVSTAYKWRARAFAAAQKVAGELWKLDGLSRGSSGVDRPRR